MDQSHGNPPALEARISEGNGQAMSAIIPSRAQMGHPSAQ